MIGSLVRRRLNPLVNSLAVILVLSLTAGAQTPGTGAIKACSIRPRWVAGRAHAQVLLVE